MKKYLYLLVLPFIATVLGGCNDDDDVMDTRLIKGQWELVSEDHSDYTYIYDFGTRGENTWSWGTLTTYYLTYGGDPVHDKVYSWHVSDPANYDQVYLELTLVGYLDSDDAWAPEKLEKQIARHIAHAGRIVAHEHHDQMGHPAVFFAERRHLGGHLGLKFR